MESQPHPETTAKPADPRARIVDALMQLAAERRFEEITIRDIAAAANASLADFRDAFPSKGAVLGGFTRRIDRAVLSAPMDDLANASPRDRLFDVLMRRFDAMAPYRDGLREVFAWLKRDPLAAVAMNQVAINSLRFMLEAAGLDSEGPAGAIKLQGLALAWARVFTIWLDDSAPDFSRPMAALDKELTQGERWVSGVEQLDRLATPFRALAKAAMDTGSRFREGFRGRAPAPDAERPAEPV